MVNNRLFEKNFQIYFNNPFVYFLLSRFLKINHKIRLEIIESLNLFIFLQTIDNRFSYINNLLVGFCKSHKYNWIDLSFKFYRFFSSKNYLMFNNFFETDLSIPFISTSDQLDSIISFKKRTSFFKKKSKLKNYLLFRTNFLRSNKLSDDFFSFFLKKNINDYIFDQKPVFKNSTDHQLYNSDLELDKLLELKRKTFWIFYQNRTILKDFFFNKKLRQFQITKFFSKLTKKSGLNLFNFFENSLFNVLVRSKLVYSWSEAIFLIMNGYIFVNGYIHTNMFLTINLGDFIQISVSKNYFNFFKKNLSTNHRFMSNMLSKVWQINRLRGNFYKQTTSNIPSWINDLMYFYDDVPDHIEIDYTVLTLTIVCVNYNFNNYNFFITKFINYFMVRHYNWKYIV